MKTMLIVCLSFIMGCQLLWAGGKKEAMEPERAEYLATRGRITPAEEIYEDSYVSSIDFQYPDPEGSFGVRFYSGNRQVSTLGQEEVILIGIQGRRFTFEDLPVMNQAFVIDCSGSMYQRDKMSWVKESFDIYLNKIREKDFVSLVVFDDTARVVLPSTQMRGPHIRNRFRDAVHAIRPGGGSNLISGLQLGYKEVLSNYHKDYVNQVLILTDGMGKSDELYEMAASYREVGINVTAIGLGEDCDLELLDGLADWAGGSSRFISSREKMGEIFGSEFGRMVIPAARNVELELYLLQNLRDVRAWGYHAEIEGQWDGYTVQEGKSPEPSGIAIGSNGRVYITDGANNRVQCFDGSGNLITQWGRMGTRKWNRENETKADRAEGEFYRPRHVAVDSEGYVYVADAGNSRVQKFAGDGTFVSQWGSPGSREAQFKQPVGVAVDSRGYVYVADSGNNRIQKFDSNGAFVARWGEYGSGNGQFDDPVAVATDPFRNVYVADSGNYRVQIFESDGTFISMLDGVEAGIASLIPMGVAVDPEGNIFIADSMSQRILKFDIEGEYLTTWGSFGREDMPFDNLSALAADAAGRVYAADSDGNRIQMFDGEGTILIKQPIRFFLPTVNLGDFETIVIQAEIPRQDGEGIRSIARLKVSYTDIEGQKVEMAPIDLTVKFVDTKYPIYGISNTKVLKAASMLHYAQALKRIGYTYYEGDIRSALNVTHEISKELHNARKRLGDDSFANELSVLETYLTILGADSGFEEGETAKMIQDVELTPEFDDRDLNDYLNNLFEEVILDLRTRESGNIALMGFSFPDARHSEIIDLLNETAKSYLSELSDYEVLEREKIDRVLLEEELSPSDLLDTNRAIAAGTALSANYIITGTVIEMSETVVIFCRTINVETAEIESACQVIVPRTAEINTLL
jgi:DNA-binding beta-propeller fold protein YncE